VSILQKSNKRASSRRQINIKGVRNGVLLLPDNRYRLVLEVSAINFELKSEQEQDAIIDTYQSLLNSLPCEVQILARVREMDMQKYLDDFRFKAESEKNKVYRSAIVNYTEFIQELVTTNKILSRRFYVIIPHADKGKSDFETVHERLLLSADIVAKSLSRLGIHTRHLDSLELLDLFYSFYDPNLAKRQPITAKTLQLLKESYV